MDIADVSDELFFIVIAISAIFHKLQKQVASGRLVKIILSYCLISALKILSEVKG